ncbi:MAG: hypothetical protein KatS3mg038_2221 [Candidatus Kapaibacterium sp.]|nr:MAG: hypothetical protein KatS3mg038_2221 [Candidatus Kapabacteria bacterium]
MIRASIDDATLQRLAANLRELAPSLERKYVRQALGRAATVIIRAVRRNLANRPHSKSARGLKRKGKPIVGLRKSVMQRPSSQWPSGATLAAKGLIGTVVGHKWPEGAHAHLVEFGHRLGAAQEIRQAVPTWRAGPRTSASVHEAGHAKHQGTSARNTTHGSSRRLASRGGASCTRWPHKCRI